MSARYQRGFHAARNTTEILHLHCVKITCQSSRKELFCMLQTTGLTRSSCPGAKYNHTPISPVVKTSMAMDYYNHSPEPCYNFLATTSLSDHGKTTPKYLCKLNLSLLCFWFYDNIEQRDLSWRNTCTIGKSLNSCKNKKLVYLAQVLFALLLTLHAMIHITWWY